MIKPNPTTPFFVNNPIRCFKTLDRSDVSNNVVWLLVWLYCSTYAFIELIMPNKSSVIVLFTLISIARWPLK